MAKSRFAPDVTSLPTATVLVPEGEYNFTVRKAEFKSGESTGKDGNPRYWGYINMQLVYQDQEAKELLGMDEPMLFSMLSMRWDESRQLNITANPELGLMLKLAGLNTEEAGNSFEDNTEDAATVEEFNEIYYGNLATALAGTELLAKVVQKPRFEGKGENRVKTDKLQNEISYFIDTFI